MVRAIDAQHAILQSTMAEKIQQVLQQNPDMQQKYLAIQLAEQDRLMKEKVKHAEETEKVTLRERQDEERRRGGKQEHDAETKGPSDQNESETAEGGHVNVTV